jgi:pyrroline-5-carboxylate reductase
MLQRKIGFIGSGVMAEALIRGIVGSKIAEVKDVCSSDPSPERREAIGELLENNVFADNHEVVKRADIVILAVKPDVIGKVAGEISGLLKPHQLVVSIAPGVTLDALGEKLGTRRLIRVMPNTPALVGEGAAAFCRGSEASEEDAEAVIQIFSSVGSCEEVKEDLMDAITGLSGSGPAYVYLAIEALSDGGVKMGLPRSTATRLAAQTVKGAASMVLESGLHPGELKDQVTTPGGTTIEGVHALEKAGLRDAFIGAVEAAAAKSRRLGE